jgi:hypothetical protein
MIELAFVVCLTLTPDVCEEQRIAHLPEIGLMACMMQAQPQIAEWIATHPGLTVTRWSCQFSDQRAFDA